MANRYIVITRQDCPFCDKAEELLSEKGLEYKTVQFAADQKDLLSEFKTAHDWTTVPMIFSRDKNNINFIGGYTDLVNYFEQKET